MPKITHPFQYQYMLSSFPIYRSLILIRRFLTIQKSATRMPEMGP